MRRPFVLEAESKVEVSVAQTQQWFLELEDHPERYRFETYAGFEFTQGGFGQTGSRFVTRERFYGLKLALHFVLGEIEDQRFFFLLRWPPLPIWGAFVIEESGEAAVRLALQVGGTAPVGEWFLKCPLVRKAVGRQIGYEVQHVKASMEALYARDRE
jgi:hypothetical protein